MKKMTAIAAAFCINSAIFFMLGEYRTKAIIYKEMNIKDMHSLIGTMVNEHLNYARSLESSGKDE